MRSGQASLEFVLVAAFLLGLITILLPTANNLVDQVSSLDDLVITKGSLTSLASAINYVYVSGNGSSMHQDVFIPKNMICFASNEPKCTLKVCKEWVTSAQNTYCKTMETLNVSATNIYPGANPEFLSCAGNGWISASVQWKSDGSKISVNCGSP